MGYQLCRSDTLYLNPSQDENADISIPPIKRLSKVFARGKQDSLIDNLLSLEANKKLQTSKNPKRATLERRNSMNLIFHEKAEAFLPEPQNYSTIALGVAMQIVVCIIYTIVNANVPILRCLSKPASAMTFSYSVGSIMLATTASNIILGLSITKLSGGACADCFALQPIVKCSPLAFLLAMMAILKFEVLTYLPATLATMLDQLRLITLAFGAWIIFGKYYSSVQIMSLIALFLAMVQYALITSTDQSTSTSRLWFGIVLEISFVAVSTVGTIMRDLTSNLSVSESGVPFSVQQCRIAIPGLLLSALYYTCLDKVLTSGELAIQPPVDVFKGWDLMTVAVVIAMIGADWLSNLIQKQLDALVVQILGCVTIAVVWIESLLISREGRFQLIQPVALVLIIVLASSFAISTQYTNIYMSTVKALRERETRDVETPKQ